MEQTLFRWYRLELAKIDQWGATTDVMPLPGGVLVRNMMHVTQQRATEFGTETDERPEICLVWVPGLTLRLDSNQKPILIGPDDD